MRELVDVVRIRIRIAADHSFAESETLKSGPMDENKRQKRGTMRQYASGDGMIVRVK
jgi:hypothetical protein